MTDDELAGLIRDAADAWRPPPTRLGRPGWEERVRRSRLARPAYLASAVGVAVLATLVLALAAPYLGLLRQLGLTPSTVPSTGGASPSPIATPLPKLATFGDPLPPTRLVIGDYQYEILDLSTGTTSGPIGPGSGCDAVKRTTDGSIACTVVEQAGSQGAVRVRLALVDPSGRTTQVVTLADYQPDAFPQAANTVVARTAFDPTAALVYVGHVVRHPDSWGIAIDLFRVPGGDLVGTLDVDEIPASGGLIGDPGGLGGVMLDRELTAPQMQIAPDGRHLVARSDLVENQGPAVSYYWSMALAADGRVSDPKPWPSGNAAGSLDDCLGDDGFASPSVYYLLCGDGPGSSVRRVDLEGRTLGASPIPADVQTYPMASAFSPRSGALFLWSGVNRSLARVDLTSGAVTGPVTAPVASAGGPLGAIGAVVGRISDWIAPPAAAKVFLQPGLVVSADGSRVYALGLAHGEPGPLESSGVYVFDGATLGQVAHWPPTAPYVSLALSGDGSLLYAAGAAGEATVPATLDQASVTVFETATGKVRAIAGQLGQSAVFFSPGGLLEIGR